MVDRDERRLRPEVPDPIGLQWFARFRVEVRVAVGGQCRGAPGRGRGPVSPALSVGTIGCSAPGNLLTAAWVSTTVGRKSVQQASLRSPCRYKVEAAPGPRVTHADHGNAQTSAGRGFARAL